MSAISRPKLTGAIVVLGLAGSCVVATTDWVGDERHIAAMRRDLKRVAPLQARYQQAHDRYTAHPARDIDGFGWTPGVYQLRGSASRRSWEVTLAHPSTDAICLLSVGNDVRASNRVVCTGQANAPAIRVEPDRPDARAEARFSTPDTRAQTLTWDFGDGAAWSAPRATNDTVTHAFHAPSQRYRVMLVATDPNGTTRHAVRAVETTDEIHVGGRTLVGGHPRAAIEVTDDTVALGERVTFDGSSSESPAGPIASYEWRVSNGIGGAGESLRTRFRKSDSYIVTLLVFGPHGESAATGTIVNVTCETVVAHTTSELRRALDDPCTERVRLGEGTFRLSGGGPVVLDRPLTIVGHEDGSVLDAGGAHRVLEVSAPGGTATLRDLTVTGGRAARGAGIRATTPLSLDGVTVRGNRATGDGGGVFARDRLVAVNTTVSGNRAGRRGGGLAVESAATLTHVTVADNTAPRGSGLAVLGPPPALRNSIVAGNRPAARPQATGRLASGGGNVVVGPCTGCTIGDRDTPPRLGPLGDHGGPTPTHAIDGRSPAAGHGQPEHALPVDQRNAPRPDGRAPDAGAYQGS